MAVNHLYEITWLSIMAINLIVLLAKALERRSCTRQLEGSKVLL